MLVVLLAAQKKPEFEIDILDVGQGDGIYIATGDGMDLFIDGGSSNVAKAGAYRILPFLKYRGIRQIDYWFVSHCDADHISGLAEIIEADYQIGSLVVSKFTKADAAFQTIRDLADKKGIAILMIRLLGKIRIGRCSAFGQRKMGGFLTETQIHWRCFLRVNL